MTHLERYNQSTICALATPQGSSALAIIRLSGPLTHSIVEMVFRPTRSPLPLSPRRIYFGGIYDGARLIDEVLVHLAVTPASFTGEDTAEISCHGSTYIIQEIMRLFVEAGATPAYPGEFSKRAFLNGKVDLAQAEAIADIIASESEAAHRLAIQQMRGGFSTEISHLRSALVDLTSLLELELDFSEEDVIFADRSQLLNLLEQIQQTIDSLCKSFSLGNVLKNGVPTAIIGATNVGKSTLLNALLNEERAIVSEVHGTTRDTIEEEMTIDGIRFRFIDTAGLRTTKGEVEQKGIERSYQKIRTTSLLLLVLDATYPELFREQICWVTSQVDMEQQQLILVLNKYEIINEKELLCNDNVILCNDDVIKSCLCTCTDLKSNIIQILFEEKVKVYALIAISAKYQLGIELLKTLLASTIRARSNNILRAQDGILVTNLRHFHTLQEAQKALDRVREGLSSSLPTDLIAQDLRQALYDLGTITGDISTEEVLGNIFGKFCIGK